MIRVLLFLGFLAACALGFAWIADHPGEILLNWQGYRIETSVGVGLAALVLFGMGFVILWAVLRFVFRIPSLMSLATNARRRNKGYGALSRGIIAAGAGDYSAAHKASKDVAKFLPNEPLALLLKAQAAQLAGDRNGTESAFEEMARQPETRLLGLRGLYMEAARRGDSERANQHAVEAHRIAALAWAGNAVLEYRTANSDWEGALATLESNASAKLIDKATADRQRAVLLTAIAQQKETTDAGEALNLARKAIKLAPDLVPAVTLAATLFTRSGNMKKASRLIETTWAQIPHPDLARAYLDIRAGDSNADRLARAKTLNNLAAGHEESLVTLARAAVHAKDFALARETLAPLLEADQRPAARVCLVMAELEETEHGATGRVREWLARASRAPRDPAWIADGIVTDTWAPASPVSGKLDAFVWQAPTEHLSAPFADWQPAEYEQLLEKIEPTPALAATPLPAPTGDMLLPSQRYGLTAEKGAGAPADSVATPRPVVFPMAPPDDPGPRAQPKAKRWLGLF